jgi:ketosteroid isomerase-like protein
MSMAPLKLQDVQQSVETANRRFEEAFNRGDAAGAARGVYTHDARILPPGADLIEGRDNIIEFWKAAAEQVRRVQLSQLELRTAGDTAQEIGRATLTLADGTEVAGEVRGDLEAGGRPLEVARGHLEYQRLVASHHISLVHSRRVVLHDRRDAAPGRQAGEEC